MINYAKIKTATDIVWDNGKLFDGFLLLGLMQTKDFWNERGAFEVIPGSLSYQKLPLWNMLRISAGKLPESRCVVKNSAITPPGTYYLAFVYDPALRPVWGPTPPFTVTQDEQVITVPPLYVPLAGVPDYTKPVNEPYKLFFIDQTDGDDGNAGTFLKPWKTAANLNNYAPSRWNRVYRRNNSTAPWVDVSLQYPWFLDVPLENVSELP